LSRDKIEPLKLKLLIILGELKALRVSLYILDAFVLNDSAVVNVSGKSELRYYKSLFHHTMVDKKRKK